MGEFDTSFSCSSLLCQETEEASLFETEREYDESIYLNYYKLYFISENEEEEYIGKLVERETGMGFTANASFSDGLISSKNWLECARLDAIKWIFNTRSTFGFQMHTAYLSVIYFDRFLSKRSIDDGKLWAIRLLSVACLSLAGKMEECRVPALSEFLIEDYQFENKVIQRMELLVLSTLEWKMGSITPVAYLPYFICKFYDESRSKGLVSKALELILGMIKEISLLDHRPSFIAAAAVLAASDSPLTRKDMELKIDFISLWGSLEKENIFSFYKMMQGIETRKSKTPGFVRYSSVNALENSSNSLAKKICRP